MGSSFKSLDTKSSDPTWGIQGLLWLPKSRSQKNRQFWKSGASLNFYKEPIFLNRNCGWLHVPLPVSCINGPNLFVQMLMSVLYFCFSFRFHHQQQKDLYITIYCILQIIRDSARILRPLVTFAERIFNELNLIISYFALLVSNGDWKAMKTS